MWDVVVIFFSSIVVLTQNEKFWGFPLYSESDMTADNAYCNPDETVHSQNSIVINESSLQI